MESLFEALYSYALKNRFDTYSLRDQEERQETEKMLQIAMEELETQGMSDAAQRIKDGFEPTRCFLGRAEHWPGNASAVVLRRQLQQSGGELLQLHAPGGLEEDGTVRANHLRQDSLGLLPVPA